MKAIKPITILLFTCFGASGIFSQTNSVLNYLPSDARMIIKINPVSLRQKIKWDDLLKYKMFEDLVKKTPREGKDFLNNPEHTGIDLNQGLFLAVPENKSNEKPSPVFYGSLSNPSDFAAMVKQLNPEIKPIKILNGNLLIDKNTAFAWNHEIFIITGSDLKEDTANQDLTAKASAELMKTKQLTEKCKLLLSKRSVAFGNEQFLSLIKEDGDLLLWIDNALTSQPNKNSKVPEAFGMLNKSFMPKGNFSSGVINFENGKVVARMKQYIPGSLDSLYKKYPVKNINTELVKKLPAGHPIFLCSFRFSPEMIKENLVRSGADKLLDSMSKQKVKIEDILPAIKGDVLLAVLKADEVAEEDSVTRGMNGIEFFVTGSINDKEKFNSLSALLQNKKQDSTKMKPAKKMKPLVLSNGSVFVVSLSQMAAQNFLASAGNNEEMGKMIDPYKNNPSACIIDLKTVFGFAAQSMLKNKTEEEVKQASEVLGMFDKLVSYGGQHDDKSMSSTVELTLTNKDENSLKQFMNLLNLIYSLKPKKSMAYNDVPIQ
ncbi:MAG: DUF4836 family protein [Chitinophagales bacterium]